jgi:ankyrin repeat protein
MSKTRRELGSLFESGDVEEVKKYLKDNPTFNVNELLDEYDYTALHFACLYGHHEIVSVLLVHPQINVNQKSNAGWTPFRVGCFNGKVGVVKVLLSDSRVDINMADNKGCTPLWYASCYEHLEVIKWMIASGREINLDKKGKRAGNQYTATEIARREKKTEVVSLLERLMANPIQTRHETRAELGLVDKDAAELFAVTVFLCDDFLRLKEPTSSSSSSSLSVTDTTIAIAATFRFFRIAKNLPMELQMILCYRVFGSGKENILLKDSEAAFNQLVKTPLFSQQ